MGWWYVSRSPACMSGPLSRPARAGKDPEPGCELLVELRLVQMREHPVERPTLLDPPDERLVVPAGAEQVEAHHPVALADDALGNELPGDALKPGTHVGTGIDRGAVPVQERGDPAHGRVLEVEE